MRFGRSIFDLWTGPSLIRESQILQGQVKQKLRECCEGKLLELLGRGDDLQI
jgi:hypothetical protein